MEYNNNNNSPYCRLALAGGLQIAGHVSLVLLEQICATGSTFIANLFDLVCL